MEQDGQKESHNGAKDGAKELAERQTIIMEEIRTTPTLRAKDLAQKTGISFRTLQRELSILQKKGFIRHEGGPKLGHWELLFIKNNRPIFSLIWRYDY